MRPSSELLSEVEISKEEGSTCASGVSISLLPTQILKIVFTKLGDIQSLGRAAQVSRKWKAAAENDNVWSSFFTYLPGLSVFTDPTDKTSLMKEKVKRYYLRVIINSEDNLERVNSLVAQYHLTSFFGTRLDKLLRKVACPSLLDTLASQGNQMTLFQKLPTIPYGQNPYEVIPEEAEDVIDKGANVINRSPKIRKNVDFSWDRVAIQCNPQVAKETVERLADESDQSAIIYKIDALFWGWHGYERDPQAARVLIDSLVDKNNDAVIERKIDGLNRGRYGYEEDPQAARDFIEYLVDRNNEEAIKRKIEGLYFEEYGYEENLTELKTFIKELALSNNPNPLGLYLYVLSLKHGLFGFDKNLELANTIIKEKGVPF